MKASIKVLRAGTYASIQDKGRTSFAKYGVPQSGFVDKPLAQKVNKILGNKSNCAILEWTQIGPQLQFNSPSKIVLSATSPQTTLNGETIRAQKVIQVSKDSVLTLGNNHQFIYSYLAIHGGFKTVKILESRSMQSSITKTNRLKIGDSLPFDSTKEKASFFTKPSFDLPPPQLDTFARAIDCYPGPEYHLLNQQQQTELKEYFTLSNQRNRMGMQLVGQIPNQFPSMLSVPILPGTLQLTPSGKLIVLAQDCQTTGGYPRILHLTEKALVQLSQTAQNVRFRFNIVEYS